MLENFGALHLCCSKWIVLGDKTVFYDMQGLQLTVLLWEYQQNSFLEKSLIW